MKSNCVIITFLLLFTSTITFSQNSATDSTFYQRAIGNALGVYHQSFGNQSALYNGSKYYQYPFNFKEGDPFFYSAQPAIGSVYYDGIKYDSLMMQYEEIKDVVVINEQAKKLQLLNEKVTGFNLYNAHFVRLVKDSFPNSPINTGFYQVLYSGNVWLLKKQVKTIREVINATEILRFADEKNHYYIKKDGQIYSIKSRNDFFNLFDDKRKELQQFVNANKLRFRKDRDNMLTRATAYYDSLKK